MQRHKPLYTSVVTSSTVREALRDLEEISENLDVIDLVELRIDYLRDLSYSSLEELLYACKRYNIPAIVTNRTKDEGGYFKGTEEERIDYLVEATTLGAAFVDVELRHYVEIEKKKTMVIVSYHNFKETPRMEELREIRDKMLKETNADITKIVTRPKTREDVEKINKLIEESEGKFIYLSLDELGKETRKNPKNYLTFVALSKEKGSAPGQPTVDDIRKELNIGIKL